MCYEPNYRKLTYCYLNNHRIFLDGKLASAAEGRALAEYRETTSSHIKVRSNDTQPSNTEPFLPALSHLSRFILVSTTQFYRSSHLFYLPVPRPSSPPGDDHSRGDASEAAPEGRRPHPPHREDCQRPGAGGGDDTARPGGSRSKATGYREKPRENSWILIFIVL